MHYPSFDIETQVSLDDELAQVMPIAATQDSEIIANRERFLAGLIARGMRVVAPNPVRYTDEIITAILGQWAPAQTETKSEPGTALVEVDFTTEEEARSSLFAEFMQQARDLKLLKINVDTAIIALLTKFAALNPSELQADLLRNAIHKATGVTRTTLRGMWKTILAKAQEAAKDAATSDRERARAAREAREAQERRERHDRLWASCKKIAESPTLLKDMEEVAHQLGVVNEGAGIRSVYLGCTSRLATDQACRLVRFGAPASGKNAVVEIVLLLIPVDAVIHLSGASAKVLAYYGGDDADALKGKILYIPEAQILAAKGDAESEFALMLRTLLSEGRLVYHVVVIPEGGGAAETITIVKNGPIAAILTTADSIDDQLKTRILPMDTDESGNQTDAIVKSILSKTRVRPVLQPWIDLQAWLAMGGPYLVEVPFSEAIYQAFDQWRASFLKGAALRIRRDISSFLTAVRASAILHRAQRETTKDGAIVATVDDYKHAHEAFDAGLSTLYGGSSDKIVATVEAIIAIRGDPDSDFSVKVTLRELAIRLRVASPMTAGTRLDEAIDYGAIERDDSMSGRGGARYYRIVEKPEEIKKRPGLGVFPPPKLVAELFLTPSSSSSSSPPPPPPPGSTSPNEKGAKKKWV